MPPGHYLKVKNGKVYQKRYWDLDFPDRGEELRQNSDKVFAETLLELLHKAVQRRLRADVPAVSYLSGGVDSAVVLALATWHRGRATPTFTITLNEKFLDESSDAAQTARVLGARPTRVRCNYQRIAGAYPRLIEAAEGPVLDTSCACLLLQAKTVHQQGYKVALTGEGADEALAGYFWFKTDKIRRAIRATPLHWTRAAIAAAMRRAMGTNLFAPSDEQYRRVSDIFGCYPAKQNEYNFFGLTREMFYSQDMRDRLAGHTAYDDHQFDVDRIKRWDPLNQSIYFGYKMLLMGLLLNQKGDRVAMHSSVETRYPFLDEDVISFCASIDPRMKLNGFKEKYLLRRVGRMIMPSEIANRPKHMFRAPLADNFFGDQAPDYAKELVSRECLHKTGYFDADAVHHAISDYRHRRRFTHVRVLQELGLVKVLAVQLWHHRYINNQPLPEVEAA